jgi:Nucleotide-diphospho-sugar transferase
MIRRHIPRAILVLLITSICFLAWIHTYMLDDTSMDDTSMDDWPPKDMIDALLAEAPDRNVISNKLGIPRIVVVAVNSAYVDFADNFANSLLLLNVTNFVFVALDKTAYEVLLKAYPKHTLPMMPGLKSFQHTEETADFGTTAFQSITASRPAFLRPFLRRGYAIFYNDVDMVWKQNAWDAIDDQDDDGTTELMFWTDGVDYQICTCLLYMVPSHDSLELLTTWETKMRTKIFSSDQGAFIPITKELGLLSENPLYQHTKACKDYEKFPAGKDYSWDLPTPKNEKAFSTQQLDY